MEHTTPTDPNTSDVRPRSVMRCPTTPGSLIDPRIEALGAFVDAEITAKADIAILLLRIGCKLQFVDRGPTIGRKRRARRARGRARQIKTTAYTHQ